MLYFSKSKSHKRTGIIYNVYFMIFGSTIVLLFDIVYTQLFLVYTQLNMAFFKLLS